MLNDPLDLATRLQDLYLKYLDSALPLRSERLMQERRQLYQAPGVLFQEPLIELVPRYEETVSLRVAARELSLADEFAEFCEHGLFISEEGRERRLYRHQLEALRAVAVERRHLIVTTGTGSGKTECFLLPIAEHLVRESAVWSENRPRAMRALLLYPLNALAEDQMVRLRRALDSVDQPSRPGARSWLKAQRPGQRFYFGRYTGRTPVPGRPETQAKQEEFRQRRNELVRQAKRVQHHSELRYQFPSLDEHGQGWAECWDRWAMQAEPPDLLITNYSMLNIMLMRDIEAKIFKKTADWLAADPWRRAPTQYRQPTRIFHLIVDELHSYRGTAGTEVAYLIRLLLYRLGLTPDSPQVRFLASSASLENSAASRDYICTFFGATAEAADAQQFAQRFAVIGGQPVLARPQRAQPLRGKAAAFAPLAQEWARDPAAAVTALSKRLEPV